MEASIFGALVILNSTINNNQSFNHGGGLYLVGGSQVSISNSTLSGNSTDAKGGGLLATATIDNFSISNSTIASNTANFGGGISIGSPVSINHTIIANNSATGPQNCDALSATSGGYNLSNTGECGFLTQPTDKVNSNPLLNALADNGGLNFTMSLGAGSPDIAAGGATCGVSIDQRDAPRPGVGKSACDMGAYETGDPRLALVSPSSGSLDFGTVMNGSSNTLMATITNTGNSTISNLTSGISGDPQFTLVSPDNSNLLVNRFRDYSVSYTPTANGTNQGMLNIAASGVVNSPLSVELNGVGAGFDVPPLQEIQDIINYVNANFYGVGPGKSAPNRFNAFNNMLTAASDQIKNGDYAAAYIQLKDALAKADGKTPPPDFIASDNPSAITTLDGMINSLMQSLGCE